MTTDTAARVTRIVVQQRKRLNEIPYVDRPDIKLPAADGEGGNSNESVSMPFKYVKGDDGKPVMPEVSIIAIKSLIRSQDTDERPRVW